MPGYTIEKLLGRGGMGAVYRGVQQNLDRPVAIKILPPGVEKEDPSFAERFKSEAKLMAKLNHPAVVTVYDFGTTSAGQLYFAMEYVDGTDVSRMIAEQKKLPQDYALAILAHMCDALGAAHELGIVHRDIKPANDLINMKGQVKVADFGLAKIEDPGQHGMTKTGYAMGTPDFVSPEALMLGTAIDGRADIYAMGVMLYQMLAGQIPRGAWQPAAVISPGIDARFDQIILKAMQYDRENRYQSTAELRQALDVILTVPLVKQDAPASAAIPVSQLAQMPAQRSAAQKPMGKAPQPKGGADIPVRNEAAAAGKNARATPTPPPAKKTPLFIGLGIAAVLAIGAFVMMSGKKPEAPPLTALGGPSAPPASAPIKVREEPKVEPPKKAEPPKPEPKPVVAAKAEPAKPAPVPEPKKEEPKPVAMAAAVPPTAVAAPQTALAGASALPPELAALNDQFIKLQAERVTAPFETDVTKLNSGYLGGIDKAIASEKTLGHLDSILALEAEKKLITEKQPIPDSDDDKTPAALKSLRTIYRSAHAKFTTTRAANLQALTDPLDKRLATMETDFTKADRVADAKTVRGYREALSESTPGLQPVLGASPPPATAMPPGDGLKPSTTLNPAALLALKDGFTNTLGMKFVLVKGIDVMFCVHEVRYKDYAAYAAESQGVDSGWKDQTFDGFAITERNADHPVVNVSWEDAQKFCAWLSQKEGKTYRLPTDEEWSIAVGLGRAEKRPKGTTPAMLSQKENTEFPWGGDFPPRTKDQAGNYSDESRKAKAPRADEQYLENYDDGHPTTAPVMSYKPNKLGLYDLGGNVWEWCEDWYDNAKIDRVFRGGSWNHDDRGPLLSSSRGRRLPGHRNDHYGGFRLVLVVGSGG